VNKPRAQPTRVGLLGATVAVLTPLLPIAAILPVALPGGLAWIASQSQRSPALAGVGAVPFGLFAVLALSLWTRARRMPRGAAGRGRGLALGISGTLAATLLGALSVLIPAQLAPLPKLVLVSPNDAWLSLAQPIQLVCGSLAGVALVALLVALPAGFSCWFLIKVSFRRWFFIVVDVLLGLATLALWVRYFRDRPHDLETARLGVSFVFFVRMGIRALPLVLNQVERFGFEAMVAARMLRAKKSGFLAAIGGLSILAVTVSSCALTTTLSVMGGFRQDLKRKILGNNAHIVVDRQESTITAYAPAVAFARGAKGVRGVSPYISGEVMISSASNLAGAILRGIDPAHIGQVSELPQNMRMGSLDYLSHPEQLTRLSTSQLNLGVGMPKVSRHRVEADVPAGKNNRLLDDLERMLDDAKSPDDQADEEAAKEPPPATEILPGIVVGQELARSLRLYLGDEVNVVTPLGDLGPSGPMPKARPFRVAGIFYSGMYEYDMKFAYVTLPAAQRFLGSGDAISGIEITVRDPERAQEVATELAKAVPNKGLRVRAWQELNKNLFGALALEKLAMFIALGIAILVASFCIVGTLTLMVQEKGREVGVLKAMGAADRAIVAVFVLEGLLIGAFGSLLGLALGYVVCFGAEHFGVRLNPEVYYIDRLPVHIDSTEFLAVGVAAVAVCLVATIYPALLASRLRPVDALRYE